MKLSEKDGHKVHMLGVVSDAFTKFGGCNLDEGNIWYFQNDAIRANGERQGDFRRGFFGPGNVVAVELERRDGRDGVMRVRVAGREFMGDMTGLPRHGMLYPVVGLVSSVQSYTMVALP